MLRLEVTTPIRRWSQWYSSVVLSRRPIALAVFVCSAGTALAAWAARGEHRAIFVASVIFPGGETRLDLSDMDATRVALPATFAGWGCYIGDTQRTEFGYTKQITCGGKWGWVDSFVSCDEKHKEGTSVLRLRQPIEGSKQAVDAAGKVTITVGCSLR